MINPKYKVGDKVTTKVGLIVTIVDLCGERVCSFWPLPCYWVDFSNNCTLYGMLPECFIFDLWEAAK